MKPSIAKRLAVIAGLLAGLALGACCPNQPGPPLRSTSLTTLRFAGLAGWGELVVDDSLTVEVDVEADRVDVFYTNEGREVVHEYVITAIDQYTHVFF